MFTLEIKGRPIAVIVADEANARDLIEDEDFKEDLQSLDSDGEPIWDGSAPLSIRAASPDEIEAAKASSDEDDEDEGELAVVFIVPLDEDDDEED
jgi:hypothetical protein